MTRSMFFVAVLCNGAFGAYLLNYVLTLPPFVQALIVNLLILVVPGIAWLGSITDRTKDSVMLMFFIIAFSFVHWIVVILGHIVAGFVPTSQSFALSALVLCNVGLVLFRNKSIDAVFASDPSGPKNSLGIMALLLASFAALYVGAARYGPAWDHDYEVPGAAPGMIKELKPYFAYNHPHIYYYFAHPPLAVVNMGLGTVFMERLGDFNFYVTSSKTIGKAYAANPGDTVTSSYPPVRPGGGISTIELKVLDDNRFRVTESNSAGVLTGFTDRDRSGVELVDKSADSVTFDIDKEQLTRYFFNHDVKKFTSMDAVLLMRIGNLMVTAFLFVMIFQFAHKTTRSLFAALLLACVYLFSTGIFVRSILAGHVGVSEFAIFVLAYQTWLLRDNPRAWIKQPIWLLPGIYAVWADQKTVLVPLAIGAYLFFKYLIESRTLAGLIQTVRDGLTHSVVFGWILGLVTFVLYGLWVDASQFYSFFLVVHGVGRLDLAPGSYVTTLSDLYSDVLVEAPVIFVTLILLVVTFIRGSRDMFSPQWGFATAAFAVGLIGFSVIDWRYSKQFMTIVPICVMLLPVLMSSLRTGQRQTVLAVLVATLAFSMVMDALIARDFWFYRPANGVW